MMYDHPTYSIVFDAFVKIFAKTIDLPPRRVVDSVLNCPAPPAAEIFHLTRHPQECDRP